MGSKYSIKVWGKHFNDEYSDLQVWSGKHFIPALWNLLKQQRLGYGCVTLECRG